jgi:hypothetical protein
MCALFGSSRDISFIKQINKELLDDIIQQEVDYYKYYLPETKGKDTENLYGEASSQKTYYTATRLTCLLTRGDQAYVQDDQFGIDVTQPMTFAFLKPKLREINLVPNAGDIIEVRGNYYEIDQVNENQFFAGKDGDYGKSVGSEFGESLSIICEAHYTRVTRLQIIKSRY